MPKKQSLSKHIRPTKTLAQLLNPDWFVGQNTTALTNLGVHRVASALASGYTKRQVCDHLSISTVTFNSWSQGLEENDKELIQMSFIDSLTELRDDALAQVMTLTGFDYKNPANDKQAKLTAMRKKLNSMSLTDLIRVHDMLDKRILNEKKGIASQRKGQNVTNNTQIIIGGDGDGEGYQGFMPPGAPAPLEG